MTLCPGIVRAAVVKSTNYPLPQGLAGRQTMSTFDTSDTADIVQVLSEDDCWELLQREHLGRLVASVGDRIDIFPINYVVDRHRLLFRTAEGTKLVELTIDHRVVFEVDHTDAVSGWSVVAHGNARTLSTSAEISAADSLDLRSWVPTRKFNTVEIVPDEITGRYVRFGDEPER
jgi:nitroimidazol reductase NimA-like FMN-containing flavoprotein (pyridoxamine 5'-phosphate oxidase superfamily)